MRHCEQASRQATAPAGPAPESPRILRAQSPSRPDDPRQTQPVLRPAARRVALRRTAHAAPGAPRAGRVQLTPRQPHGERGLSELVHGISSRRVSRLERRPLLPLQLHTPLPPQEQPLLPRACRPAGPPRRTPAPCAGPAGTASRPAQRHGHVPSPGTAPIFRCAPPDDGDPQVTIRRYDQHDGYDRYVAANPHSLAAECAYDAA